MTTPANAAHSMRFAPDELLSGMLATVEGNDFPADPPTLQTIFVKIATEFPLFAPFTALDDAVGRASPDVGEAVGVGPDGDDAGRRVPAPEPLVFRGWRALVGHGGPSPVAQSRS